MKRTPPLVWVSACGRYRVKIARRCFLRMRKVALAQAPLETGSSIAGRYVDDGHTAVVEAISPTPLDSSATRMSFVRGVRGLKEYFSSVFRRFHGARYRIGEWHSHPGNATAASSTDDANQWAIATDERESLPEAILIIIGGNLTTTPLLGVYVYSRRRDKFALSPTDAARGPTER